MGCFFSAANKKALTKSFSCATLFISVTVIIIVYDLPPERRSFSSILYRSFCVGQVHLRKEKKYMANLKRSKQRECIKAFLATRTDHPTADTIYMNIRQEFPNISLGTVYRNLALLSDLGEIMKITTDGGADRFDGNATRHHHFICTKCHRVMDLDMPSIDGIMETAQQCCTGKIQNYVTHFYGICGDCIDKN